MSHTYFISMEAERTWDQENYALYWPGVNRSLTRFESSLSCTSFILKLLVCPPDHIDHLRIAQL